MGTDGNKLRMDLPSVPPPREIITVDVADCPVRRYSTGRRFTNVNLDFYTLLTL